MPSKWADHFESTCAALRRMVEGGEGSARVHAVERQQTRKQNAGGEGSIRMRRASAAACALKSALLALGSSGCSGAPRLARKAVAHTRKGRFDCVVRRLAKSASAGDEKRSDRGQRPSQLTATESGTQASRW
eukprot:6190704-Pleurochrysis_carterae.AAC.1